MDTLTSTEKKEKINSVCEKGNFKKRSSFGELDWTLKVKILFI